MNGQALIDCEHGDLEFLDGVGFTRNDGRSESTGRFRCRTCGCHVFVTKRDGEPERRQVVR